MPVLKRAVWEIFAQHVAGGMVLGEAYGKAFGREKPRTADYNGGYRLLKRDDVLARVTELKEKAALETHLSLSERLTILSKIARTAIEDRDRINAINSFTKIRGDGAADRLEVGPSKELADIIHFIRSGQKAPKTIDVSARAELMNKAQVAEA